MHHYDRIAIFTYSLRVDTVPELPPEVALRYLSWLHQRAARATTLRGKCHGAPECNLQKNHYFAPTARNYQNLTMANNFALAPRSYRSSLAALMSHRDGVVYTANHVFEADHLASVTADDVAAFFNFRAFGTSTPTLDDKPTKCRSNSLEYWKKSISFFMPLKNHKWNELTKQGNPTKSL